MIRIDFVKLKKVERKGRPAIYALIFVQTGQEREVLVKVYFEQVADLIMEFHYLGVLGHEKKTKLGCITEWKI
jgi:hypothetical protein